MKETFSEYSESKASRGRLNAAVHNSAAVLAAEQLRRVLTEPKEAARPAVLIATGIPGAGKTSLVLGIGHLPRAAHAAYEGQMADPRVAVEKVKQVSTPALRRLSLPFIRPLSAHWTIRSSATTIWVAAQGSG